MSEETTPVVSPKTENPIRKLLSRLRKDTKQLSQEEMEINSIRNVRDTYTKHITVIKKARKNQDEGLLYGIVEKEGYQVRELPLGSTFTDYHGNKGTLNRENSVRIGENKLLFVGTEAGNIHDFEDLVHDVGACLLGGKGVNPSMTPLIRINTLNEVAKMSSGMTPDMRELNREGFLRTKGKETFIPDTYLFDALVQGKITYKTIKYVPER